MRVKTRRLILASLAAIVAILMLVSGAFLWLASRDLPDIKTFLHYRPYQTAYFFDRYGEKIGCVRGPHGEWRDLLKPEEAASLLVAKVILAKEDQRFYDRDITLDLRAITRAFVKNLFALKVIEGGSTIHTQLAKHLLPPEERARKSVIRKLKEFRLARRLVQRLSKDEILTLYLNEVYLGHQAHGVEAASRLYYNKSAAELTLSEAATLAGIIHAPERLSPRKHPDKARIARNVALVRAKNYLDADGKAIASGHDIGKAREEPIRVSKEFENTCSRDPHAVDHVRKEMAAEHNIVFNEAGTNPAWFGLRVTITLDWELQRHAQDGAILMLKEYKERQGELAIDAEGATVVIEHGTGAILALVGGSNYGKRQFNHATQGERQIGSAFKPFVYLARFEQELAEGKDPEKILDRIASNADIRCPKKRGADPNNPDDWWEPQNYDDARYSKAGYTRRLAIAKSINRPAVHTARIGRCGLDPRVIAVAERLGLSVPIPPYLPSALGASSHSLLEVARAYTAFPSQGFLRPTYIISQIKDAAGNEYFKKDSWKPAEQVISETLARIMLDALRGAVKFGTAASLANLSQPLACKTGTTNNFTDALIFCSTPDITIGVWMGGPKDYTKSLGDKEFGARTAVVVRHMVENWYRGQESRSFPEESVDMMKLQNTPDLFEKELTELENEKVEEKSEQK